MLETLVRSLPYVQVQGYLHQKNAKGFCFPVIKKTSWGWRSCGSGLRSEVNMVVIQNVSLCMEVKHDIRLLDFGKSSDGYS